MEEFKLENLPYQETAIQSAVKVFDGTEKNTVNNACIEGIRSNLCTLSAEQIATNIKAISEANGIDNTTAKFSPDNDLCIEMETGTGKTLVYIQTIYELYKNFGLTKFIILVPSIAIRQGVLGTFKDFEKQLIEKFGVKPNYFEYDSKRLGKVNSFIEEQHPQVMIMTTGAFSSDDRILNRVQREDLFHNLPYIDAIAKVRPIIIMDEPQEGMDSDNMTERLRTLTTEERETRYKTADEKRESNIFKTLDPLIKIRYSATHKNLKNMVYRLTPYDSYKEGLVKKVVVHTVVETNDDASLKLELAECRFTSGKLPTAKLRAWIKDADDNYKFKETAWLKPNDDLFEKTNNITYQGYRIEHIRKNIDNDSKSEVTFQNKTLKLIEQEKSGNIEAVWQQQMFYLIKEHFDKKKKLAESGIKCLSLIFIDKVANYMDTDNPKIKTLFVKEYQDYFKRTFPKNPLPTADEIEKVQGFYFATDTKKSFTDNERSIASNKEIYDLILKGKKELLNLSNPVEFIFSHSALGVGWDNPNIFNIATLNQTFSESKKRQEIGRGLRLSVNQTGARVRDLPETKFEQQINVLTVFPNESYHAFVSQYQEQIKKEFGDDKHGQPQRHKHKGEEKNNKDIKRNENIFNSKSFQEFWKRLSRKTTYSVKFEEEELLKKCIDEVGKIFIPASQVFSKRGLIVAAEGKELKDEYKGEASKDVQLHFPEIDLVEEISENSGLAYPKVVQILKGISNHKEVVKNPIVFVQRAAAIIRQQETEFMCRGLEYFLSGEQYDIADFPSPLENTGDNVVDTPNKGVYEKVIWQSFKELEFAKEADKTEQSELLCFIKFPSFYKIPTPFGNYIPDFGVVLKRNDLETTANEFELYFVVETKGTNDINDKSSLTEHEVFLMKAACKHFQKLDIDAKIFYNAPVQDFSTFKKFSQSVKLTDKASALCD